MMKLFFTADRGGDRIGFKKHFWESGDNDMICEFAEEAIAKKKRLITIIAVLMPVFLAVLVFFGPFSSYLFIFKCVIFLGSILVLIPIILIVPFIQFRQFRQMSVKIENDSIIRMGVKSHQTILLKDIIRVISIEDVNGTPLIIKIQTKNRVDHLSGFNSMESIIDHIASNTEMEIEKKTRKIDWESPKIFIPYFIIICLITVVAFNFDEESFLKFAYISGMAAGLYFITYRPLSKSQGDSKRKTENIVGWALIILNIINIILSYIL